MNTKLLTRILSAVFGLLVIFLTYVAAFRNPTAPKNPLATTGTEDRLQPPLDLTSKIRETDRPVLRPAGIKLEDSTPEKVARHSPKQNEISEKIVADPNQALMDSIKSLTVQDGCLVIEREVERRLKTSEKERAKLIFSEMRNGKVIEAFAVRNPKMQETLQMFKPYELFLALQTDAESRDLVESSYRFAQKTYRTTEGRYRLIYATIPEGSEGMLRVYSFAASSENDAMNILSEELKPPTPVVIGVTYGQREGVYISIKRIDRGKASWRLDQLIDRNKVKQFIY